MCVCVFGFVCVGAALLWERHIRQVYVCVCVWVCVCVCVCVCMSINLYMSLKHQSIRMLPHVEACRSEACRSEVLYR